MLRRHAPDDDTLLRFLASQGGLSYSYPDVGGTRGRPPERHVLDHNRVMIGRGPHDYARAVSAVRQWRMFDLGWIRLFPPAAPIAEGSTVTVVARVFGLYFVNACRIVYTFDEPERRFGFAYGTLPDHVESGEERFAVEIDADGAVWYDVLAFSRPRHPLVWLGFPIARHLQRRFARDSMAAMQR